MRATHAKGLAFGLALLGLLGQATDVKAALQKWSVVYLDSNGAETTPNRAATAEAWASDQRGFTLGVGCASGGGNSITLSAPEGEKPDFAGPAIEPSFRISKPGTDLFLGPIGEMTFDGSRYVGKLPEPAVAPMRTKIKDGLVTFTEFGTRTIISLKTQRLEFAISEVTCE